MTVQKEARIAALEVLDPVARVVAKTIRPAPRTPDLSGRKIGLYSNTKPRTEAALDEAARLLSLKFQDLKFEKFASKPPHAKDFLAKVLDSGCDAMIGCSAD